MISLPNDLDRIGEGWFRGASAEGLILESRVGVIEACAFQNARLGYISFSGRPRLRVVGRYAF